MGSVAWPEEDCLGARMTIAPKTVLLREGEDVRTIYLLVEGITKVQVSRDGRDVVVAILTAGALPGAMSAVCGGACITTVVAMTSCAVRSLQIRDFHALRAANAAVGTWVQGLLAGDLHTQIRRAVDTAAGGAERRAEGLFRELFVAAGAPQADGSILLRLPLMVTEIADLILASRPWTSKMLARWERQRKLFRKKGWYLAPEGSPLRTRNRWGEAGRNR
jgi:CRP-like cAMP-binding protein